jgi:hypothetical protein
MQNILPQSQGSIFGCADAELPGKLKDRGSLMALWHKNIPYSPTYSKVRKENALSG